MRIGFTGTQTGMTNFQKETLKEVLKDKECSELLHGDCIGADSQAHDIAKELGISIFTIYPPNDWKKRAWKELEIKQQIIGEQYCKIGNIQVKWKEEQKYLERNKRIVEDCQFLIACPKEHQHTMRSGTWATIRYAWKLKKDIIVIPPIVREDEEPNVF